MAPVLWTIAILGNITVIHRMMHTWDITKAMDIAEQEQQGNRVLATTNASR